MYYLRTTSTFTANLNMPKRSSISLDEIYSNNSVVEKSYFGRASVSKTEGCWFKSNLVGSLAGSLILTDFSPFLPIVFVF